MTTPFTQKFGWIKRRARALQKLYKVERKLAVFDAWQDWIRQKAGQMRSYLIHITMPDGSKGEHHGIYQDGFEAAIKAMDLFPSALRISARRLS